MGTRSVVAVPDAEHGWKGRYVHWDGYPSGVGEAVRRAVMRDGYETAVRTLTVDHTRWSTLDGRSAEDYEPPSYYPDEIRHFVPGYGVAPDDQASDDWVYADGDDWGTEWAYLLGEGGIAVYERRFGQPGDDEGHGVGMFGLGASDTVAGGYWKHVGFCPYGADNGMSALEALV